MALTQACIRPTMQSSHIKATTTFENICKILGTDNMRNIFEFDNTYKNIYSKQVVSTVWKESWKHWRRTNPMYQNPFVSVAIEYLFSLWGVENPNAMLYFKKNYLPSDIQISVYEVVPASVYSVSIFIEHRNFNCFVSTEEYNKKNYMGIEYDEESNFYNMMEVFTNGEFVLYIEL